MRYAPLLTAWIVLGPVLAGDAAVGPAEAVRPAIRTPAEIFAVLEASTREYTITSPGELKDVSPGAFASKLWPPRGEPTVGPRVVTAPDGRSLDSVGVDAEARRLLEKGEPAFAAKRYADALEVWTVAAARFPEEPMVHVYVGDAWFFLRRYDEALAAYERAAALNPWDYQAQVFRAHALYRLGRKDEALEGWIHALVLRPRQESTIKLVGKYARDLGIAIHADGFVPRAFVRKEGSGTTVYTPAESPWLVWASCKAAWMTEPEFRSADGVTPDGWSSIEERECLANLWALYTSLRADEKTPRDEVIEVVGRIIEADLLGAFILYEMGARMWPDIVLLQDDTTRADVARYIRTFVLSKAEPGN